MLFDFHTHTTLSDGELSPIELLRRCVVLGYEAVAITDHVGPGELATVIKQVAEDCALARAEWGILALPGVELTHVPAAAIDRVAAAAKALGAAIVVVHGETVVEPVEPGTNLAAIRSPHVDILAHPGLLTAEEAALAAATDTFLELTSRAGHCLGNGLVAALAVKAGAPLIVNSDSHSPGNLLDARLRRAVAVGAGLSEADIEKALVANPRALLNRIKASL